MKRGNEKKEARVGNVKLSSREREMMLLEGTRRERERDSNTTKTDGHQRHPFPNSKLERPDTTLSQTQPEDYCLPNVNCNPHKPASGGLDFSLPKEVE